MQALIFDFDGVIADSEVLSNTVLAEIVTELGVPTTVEDSYSLYMGKRFADIIAAIESAVGRRLPVEFAERCQARTLDRFRRELTAVAGARAYIGAFPELTRCIASSSSPDRLALCLDVLGMTKTFGKHVFSASMVARGKPFPDIYLYASGQVGVAPSNCIVIEDSASGVEAARAAGMTVIGLLAASHIRPGHGELMAAAGAHHVARDFAEAERITWQILCSG